MLMLIAGVALWIAAHLFKRVAPDARAALGDKGKGLVALAIAASLIMMIVGYRVADGAFFWGRTPMLVGTNNLLMIVAVYMFAAAGNKTALARKMRHPMLGAVKVWALGHLLVNGDMPSVVLFGGLLVWAVTEMIVINRSEPDWTPPPPAPKAKEIRAVVGTLIFFTVAAGIHYWLGYPTFG